MQWLRNRIYRLLRSSERYTKTDMVYLTKGGFWLSVGQGVAMLSGLALSIGFANLLPQELFGIYKYVLSTAAIIGAFSLTGMSTAMVRAIAKGNDGAFRVGVRTFFKWSALIPILAGIGAAYYFYQGDSTLAIGLLLAGAFVPLTRSAELYGSYLEGKKLFKLQTIWSTFRNIIPAAALLITLFLTNNPIAILAVYYVSTFITTSFFYHQLLRRFNPPRGESPGTTSYAKHLSLLNVVSTVAQQMDKLLVFQFLGAAPLAIYVFAIAPVDQLRTGNKILQKLLLPKLSAGSFSELQKTIPRKAVLLFVFLLILTFLYILLAPALYSVLFPQYLDAIFLSQLYALVLLFTPAILFNQSLVAHKKTRELYWVKITIPLTKIALFLALLPLYGLKGLIVALILTAVGNLLLQAYLHQR